MKLIKNHTFTGQAAWDALDIANMNGITTRLHWTDQAYQWHVNDGEEVFVVLSGRVKMLYREDQQTHEVWLDPGDIFFAEIGTEHLAQPQGEARILVIEKAGSI